MSRSHLVKGPSRSKFVIMGFFGLFIAAILAWFVFQSWYQGGLKPVSSTVAEQQITIEEGTSNQGISERLYNEGIIRNSSVFDLYIRRSGKTALKAGVYKVGPHMTVQEIVSILHDGSVDTSLVTVPPGIRLDQVVGELVDQGIDKASLEASLNKERDHPVLEALPEGSSLEGYIYPETLQITTTTTADELIERYLDAFYDVLTTEIQSGLKQQGLDLHEAITLASIVQKEISDPEDQRIVAQVFLKRLEVGEPLGSDVTFFYAAEILGVEPAVDLDSPYNTRIVGGLPPGPISNFNLSALEAVASPADTDFLFFVAGDDGNTYFSNTVAEHEANVAKYCIELCKL